MKKKTDKYKDIISKLEATKRNHGLLDLRHDIEKSLGTTAFYHIQECPLYTVKLDDAIKLIPENKNWKKILRQAITSCSGDIKDLPKYICIEALKVK